MIRIEGPLPGNVGARAEAQLQLVGTLLDRAEVERGERRAASVSEAGQLLRLVERTARTAATDRLPNASFLVASVGEQTARLRRLGG